MEISQFALFLFKFIVALADLQQKKRTRNVLSAEATNKTEVIITGSTKFAVLPKKFNVSTPDTSTWSFCLQATAVTEMFQHGAPEKLIQEWTGHRSLNEDQHKHSGRKPEKVQYTNNVQMQSSMSNAYAASLFMHGCVINNYYGAPTPLPQPTATSQPSAYY